MEEVENRNTALKKALERRGGQELPSNFSYRMMEKVHLEAVRKRKRQKLFVWSSLIAATLLILSMLIYFLFFYMELEPGSVRLAMPQIKTQPLPKAMMDFYWYIGAIVMILLGLDYVLRNKRRKFFEE
ncbi:hypothetical protein LJC21_01840 [Bacteroides sp. OttesenSCG-928-E20]|nr:hypothetical protein [Bacteroides sp. OttesenSCG-928-E20]MDL2304430.1 hypothetical protein [Bacteroides sp. OttesenSCG-928-D19]